jgi:hypothetical protein
VAGDGARDADAGEQQEGQQRESRQTLVSGADEIEIHRMDVGPSRACDCGEQ